MDEDFCQVREFFDWFGKFGKDLTVMKFHNAVFKNYSYSVQGDKNMYFFFFFFFFL